MYLKQSEVWNNEWSPSWVTDKYNPARRRIHPNFRLGLPPERQPFKYCLRLRFWSTTTFWPVKFNKNEGATSFWPNGAWIIWKSPRTLNEFSEEIRGKTQEFGNANFLIRAIEWDAENWFSSMEKNASASGRQVERRKCESIHERCGHLPEVIHVQGLDCPRLMHR